MLYDAGLYYVGSWVDNCRHGFGFMIDSQGAYYKGQWMFDYPNGFGEYVDGSLDWKYRGKWKNGMKEEAGEEIFPDGVRYVGGYHSGKS